MVATVVATERQARRAVALMDRAQAVQGLPPSGLWYEELLGPKGFASIDDAAGAVIVLFEDEDVGGPGTVAWWTKVIGGPTAAWAGIIRATKAHFVNIGKGRVPLYYPIHADARGTLVDANTRDLLTSDDVVIRGTTWRRHLAETAEPTRR